MTLKHNMSSVLGQGDSTVFSLFSSINSETNFLFAYLIILSVFIISAYFLIRKTNDIGKSLLSANYITFLSALFLYFGGKVFGVDFIPDLVMLFLAVALAVGTAVLSFMRWKG